MRNVCRRSLAMWTRTQPENSVSQVMAIGTGQWYVEFTADVFTRSPSSQTQQDLRDVDPMDV